LPKAPSPLPSKKKKKIPAPQKTYNRIMLDNKRRIGERKSKICLFHYPHDKIPPKKKNKANECKPLNTTQKQPHKKPQRKTITNGPCKRKKERTRVILEHRRTNRTTT
jgi:hypothetical protein